MNTRARRFIANATGRIAMLAACAAALVAPFSAAYAAAPAAGGERLIESMQRAPATVVGDVVEVEVLDRRARRATLRVESVLRGPDDPRFAAGVDGAGLRVAFEERVPTRPDRFAPGDRVLVVLEPLPGASIWLQRLPEPAERSATLSVAADGNAFLRRPALGSIRILEHYLALPSAEQLGPAGVPHLAALAEGASPPLAIDAVNTLQRIPRLDPLIDAVSARRLVAALLRADARPRLEEALLALIERKQLQSLRTPLGAYAEQARSSGATGDAPPVIYAALARLDGGLAPSDREALARSESSERRLAWVRSASEAGDAARLEQWLRGDPSPEVRAAAASKLAGLEGMRAEPPLLEALGDEGPGVREAAIAGLAELGPAAVPGLVARLGDEAAEPSAASSDPAESRASVAAIRALSLIRPEGTAALAEIADDHPNGATRAAARLALGRPLVEPH